MENGRWKMENGKEFTTKARRTRRRGKKKKRRISDRINRMNRIRKSLMEELINGAGGASRQGEG
jgi:hypothetical protein